VSSNNLGKTIRILRQAKNMRAQALAEASKISVSFLSLVENNERQPSLVVLRRIAGALDVPSEALVLVGMGPDSALHSSDRATTRITTAIGDLIHSEDQLKRLLGAGEARREIQ
jgi:transcriptional regulator with XRE-family HTH domain